MSTANSRNRAVRACVICHKKKVRCDIGTTQDLAGRCSSCIRDDYQCLPRERKRKRYTFSPSPPPVSPKHRRHSSLVAGSIGALVDTGEAVPAPTDQMELHHDVQGTRLTDAQSVLQSPSSNAPSNGQRTEGHSEDRINSIAAYLDRSQYISSSTVAIDEDQESESGTCLSETDLQILNIQRVYDLPTRPVYDSLLYQFWTYCYPWTPVVEQDWIENKPQNEMSPLLIQSILLAGSRVSLTTAATYSEDLYKKGKSLFWVGAEQDPMIMTIASILLNWWNPQAPSNVSIDTSAFWMRIGVSLAYQIGLHKKSDSHSDTGLRKRIWWSLVVSRVLFIP
jgi:hypothetical protein